MVVRGTSAHADTDPTVNHSGRHFHKECIYGTGPRKPLDRETRAQWLARLRMFRTPEGITIAAMKLGEVMIDMTGRDGRLDPSHETLAQKARMSVATVKRALHALKKVGLIDWQQRMVKAGWRVVQTTNAYWLRIAAHFDREVLKSRFSKGKQPLAAKAAAKADATTTTTAIASDLARGLRGEEGPSDLTDEQARANRDKQLRLLGML